jgi:hypothetical protein
MSVLSDFKYNYDLDEESNVNYDDDEDDDNRIRINSHLVEDLEDINEYERGIMLAETKVDDKRDCLGCTVFQRKGYDSRTESASWTVRKMLEEEEN